jgi:hypothetical protein
VSEASEVPQVIVPHRSLSGLFQQGQRAREARNPFFPLF